MRRKREGKFAAIDKAEDPRILSLRPSALVSALHLTQHSIWSMIDLYLIFMDIMIFNSFQTNWTTGDRPGVITQRRGSAGRPIRESTRKVLPGEEL